jgi:hypothetical protein
MPAQTCRARSRSASSPIVCTSCGPGAATIPASPC